MRIKYKNLDIYFPQFPIEITLTLALKYNGGVVIIGTGSPTIGNDSVPKPPKNMALILYIKFTLIL